MSDATAVVADAPQKAAKPKRSSPHGVPFYIAVMPMLILFSFAAWLFWSAESSGATGRWEGFIYVVAVISLFSGWSQAYLDGTPRLWYLIKQAIHWGGLILLVYMINTQGLRELMSDQQYTSVLLYLLAFATLLAAIHMDLKLFFFSLFLVFCAYLIAVPEANPALIALGNATGIEDAADKPVDVALIMAGVGFVASLFVLLMMRGALMSKRVADKRKAKAEQAKA